MTSEVNATRQERPLECAVVPLSELRKLEQARLALWQMFPDADTAMVVRLSRVTDVMWDLANRRWPRHNAALSGKPAATEP